MPRVGGGTGGSFGAHTGRSSCLAAYDKSILKARDSNGENGRERDDEDDPVYDQAIELVARMEEVSVSKLQREMRRMGREGIVGPPNGVKPRQVPIRPIGEVSPVPKMGAALAPRARARRRPTARPGQLRPRQVNHERVVTDGPDGHLPRARRHQPPNHAHPLDGVSLVDPLLGGTPLPARDLFWGLLADPAP